MNLLVTPERREKMKNHEGLKYGLSRRAYINMLKKAKDFMPSLKRNDLKNEYNLKNQGGFCYEAELVRLRQQERWNNDQ
jgi:hypothetical protein